MSLKTWAALAGGLTVMLLQSSTARAESLLDNRVSVSLEGAAPADTFRSIAQMANLNVVVDPDLREPVTILVRNVRLETVLDAICESIGCEWQLKAGKPSRLEVRSLSPSGGTTTLAAPEEPIDLKVSNAGVRDLLSTFAEIANFQPDIDPRVTGTVTIAIEHTPYNEALDRVCAAAGCEWKIVPGNPPALKVTPKPKK